MKPLATLSLDLDNEWSYLKTHGDADWASYPSYLDLLARHVVPILSARGLRLTLFVVGRDAALDKNREALASLAAAGHEVANHSFRHEPWLHLYSRQEIEDELARAEEAIGMATGAMPRGFRGPGYSISEAVLRVLQARGYTYDASTLPTYLGPLARAYYLMTAELDEEERERRAALFGSFADGRRPLRPYLWDLGGADLLEIPVTTVPLFRVPFHLSYVIFLSTYSTWLARSYFRAALVTCRASGVSPSLLLHPLDFLGGDEVSSLSFFPGMNLPGEVKRQRVAEYLDDYRAFFTIEITCGARRGAFMQDRLGPTPPEVAPSTRLDESSPECLTPVGASEKNHCLTVAVEDYFHATPFSNVVSQRQWSRFESRVADNTARTLALLDEFGIKGTFFVLGWVAEHMPEVPRDIAAHGHEVASKGFLRRPVQQLTREQFTDDLCRSRDAIESATGTRVLGYRVPQGALRLSDYWLLDVLTRRGFVYDSSMYPRWRSVAHQPWRRFPHVHSCEGKALWEFPLATWGLPGLLLPMAGGNYFRQTPAFLVKHAIRTWHEHYDAPFTMYFHVWELDPALPKISAIGPLAQIRQYRNLDKMEELLRGLFSTYRFQGIAQALGITPLRVTTTPPRLALPPLQLLTRPSAIPNIEHEATPVTVVVPCFNEESALPFLRNTLLELVESLGRRYSIRFLFVDDGSSDATAAVLQRLFGDWPNVGVLRHSTNRGVAAAIRTGVRAAETEVVCSIDCDCTYDPHQLADMIPRLTGDVDMVTASPYHPDGEVRNVPAWRLGLSKSLSRMYRVVLHERLATYTSCFRVYRKSAVERLALRHGGFLGVAELLGRLDLEGGRIVEHPAVLEVRMLGHSKMKIARTILGHVRLLADLGWSRLRGIAREHVASA